MRVGSLRLVLRVVFLALAASLLLSAGAPAASLPDYRCCFRIDALMTGQLDTVYDDLPGKPSDDERATFTFMTSELLVYSFTGGRPHLRRAFTRRGGPWPQTDGPGVAFGVGRVTTHDGGRVTCDVEDSSRVYTSAPNLMNRMFKGVQGLHLRVEVGQGVADIGGKADRACDETQHGVQNRPSRRAQCGRADVAPARSAHARSVGDAQDEEALARAQVRQGRQAQPDPQHPDPAQDDGLRARRGLHQVRRSATGQVRGGEDPRSRRQGADASELASLFLGRRHDPHASVEAEVAVLHEVCGRRHPQLDRPRGCAVERAGEPRRDTGVVPGDRHAARRASQHVRVRDSRRPTVTPAAEAASTSTPSTRRQASPGPSACRRSRSHRRRRGSSTRACSALRASRW